MRAFSYAQPGTTSEALEILNEHTGQAAVLAGGTDLLSLMKDSVVSPGCGRECEGDLGAFRDQPPGQTPANRRHDDSHGPH